MWPVHAETEKLDTMSAHVDYGKLSEWISHMSKPPRYVYITHGAKEAAGAFKKGRGNPALEGFGSRLHARRKFIGLIGLCIFVFYENTPGRAVHIVILARFQAPYKNEQPEKAECKGDKHNVEKSVHEGDLTRNELMMTTSDDPDMAMAARSGVKSPSMATGMATTL